MKSLRIGLIGAGFIAGNHVKCLLRCYGAEINIVGVYDVIEEKCRKFADEKAIKAFSSLEDLLKMVDAVIVCSPPYAHYENIVAAAHSGVNIICEKPLIGFSPPLSKMGDFNGLESPKSEMLQSILEQLRVISHLIQEANIKFIYFENFVYTPQIQKEAEIVRKTHSQILRMMGEESHKGNHASYSSWWKQACGGSLISTGSHPIGALLYLKRVEGIANRGIPIRPASVSARIHTLTKINGYRNEGFIRADYHDVEDYAWTHIVFEDGTVGDVIAGATVLGGINDYVDVFANNHRTHCTINPVDLVRTYNPLSEQFDDIYINYGISTQEGWLNAAPDEDWMFGYQAEMQNAVETILYDREPESGLQLAMDTTNIIYTAYLSAEDNGREVAFKGV